MNMVFAQDSFFDNTWPESFRFPFGEWIKQLVFWAVNNPVTSTIGDIVEWPFSNFFSLIMSKDVNRDSITTIPWIWLVVAVFLVASFTRNTRVGLACGAMLSVCGFLGPEYWTETAKTIGMIIVSVTLCAIVGIPLGIMSGRFDSVWNVVRPTLDAMQVVHSFVFMLPFIFFFSIGEVSATMVTMVFALPPLVRLTNLGIRQVPEDVVEASRSYGATELRVLTDVQLPLARQAIMTGLNQTLLLAISMLGIAAIMGAGGLGKLLFRAINNLDLGLAASGGLAFFLVAVILDRISQTEAQDGISLLTKVRQAWSYRADPEGLLAAQGDAAAVAESAEPAERPQPVTSMERTGLLIAMGGSVLMLISLFLPWSKNAGLVSSWGRFADETELQGLSFNGYQASGGTFYGIIAGALALYALFAAIRPNLSKSESVVRNLQKAQGVCIAAIGAIIVVIWLMQFTSASTGTLSRIGLAIFAVCVVLILTEVFAEGTPRLGADGVLLTGLGALGATLGYYFIQPSKWVVEDFERGVGSYVAIAAALIIVAGGIIALESAPYGPRRPLPIKIGIGRLIAAAFAILLVLGSAFGVGNPEKKTEFGWYFDERVASIQRESSDVPPDIEAEIERITEEAGDDIAKQIVASQTITNLINTLQTGSRIVHNGVSEGGPNLGPISIVLAVAGALAAIPASGLLGGGETRRWQGSALMAGIGLALMAVPLGFILGIMRTATGSRPVSGVGAFMTVIAGFLMFAAGRSLISQFTRRKLYSDPAHLAAEAIGDNPSLEASAADAAAPVA